MPRPAAGDATFAGVAVFAGVAGVVGRGGVTGSVNRPTTLPFTSFFAASFLRSRSGTSSVTNSVNVAGAL